MAKKVAIKDIEQLNIPKTKKICVHCGDIKPMGDFYKDKGTFFIDKVGVCKKCMEDKELLDTNDKFSIHRILSIINRPLITDVWLKANDTDKQDIWGAYLRMIALNHGKLQYKDGEKLEVQEYEVEEKINSKDNKIKTNKVKQKVINYNKSQTDIVKLLKYDPFENESKEDKNKLYNKLLDFLDESTLEDSFKVPAVIEIVKSDNQLEKVNNQISKLLNSDATDTAKLKSLVDSKKNMWKNMLDLAKDNGISVNYSNNKSKGAGTLSGIMKKLQELGFDESEVNLFNIETLGGIKQVADESNQSIMEQLQFDENDYTEMITEQRILINKFQNKAEEKEEEVRNLKILLKNNNIQY